MRPADPAGHGTPRSRGRHDGQRQIGPLAQIDGARPGRIHGTRGAQRRGQTALNTAKETVLHGMETPSEWVRRWSHLVPERGVVLDVACGHGRHARWFYKRNHPVVLVDRARDAIESIAIPAQAREAVVADIEN